MLVSDAIRLLNDTGMPSELESRSGASDSDAFERFERIGDAGEESAVFIGDHGSPQSVESRLSELGGKSVALAIVADSLRGRADFTRHARHVLFVSDARLAFAIVASDRRPPMSGYIVDAPDAESYRFREIFAHGKSAHYYAHKTARIHSGATIGAGSVIGPNVTIYRHVSVGENCIIEAGCEIGGEGTNTGRIGDRIIQTPHLGRVEIRDGVRLGPYTVVQRAVLGSTVVGRDSRTRHFSIIGHGSYIGERVIITSHVTICGCVKIADDVFVGPNVTIREGVEIGRHAFIGMGAAVRSSIPAECVVAAPRERIVATERPW